MLVLTRKPGEAIHLYVGDEEITVYILPGGSPGQTRVGIEASAEVKILRAELVKPEAEEG